ncbi:LOW QUALITY PROTEIN: olfactory receptor 5V1-like [Chelonoidis abingdonii]|uniref:LOW QUALITY PROTEIN: olfactory receptor 5V1-like n=1 Tax=Chelonoidis abingdonii TaxID=106734 RepID=UPI0013F20A55|nr:LOW QUALITY PROTEIN: olfactory receptor 5V1-like [Chelonoidis abingdonii]
MANGTIVAKFVLIGLSNCPAICFSLFGAFLLMCLITLTGNGLKILAIGTKAKLHNPLDFFLHNFSLLDICCPTATMPKMLENLLSESNIISFISCMSQVNFLVAVAGREVFLLAVMAYSWYVAVCNPLRYMVLRSKRLCVLMTMGTWFTRFLSSLLHTVPTVPLPFCHSNKVNQYYCDIPPLLASSCTSTYRREMAALVVGGIFHVGIFLVTQLSYIQTLWTIQSAKGKHKAFSTCTSHLMVVHQFYNTTVFSYFLCSSSFLLDQDRLVAMLYGMFTSMLTSITYSVQNMEVKEVLRSVIGRKCQGIGILGTPLQTLWLPSLGHWSALE